MAQQILMKLSNGGCSSCDPPPAPGFSIGGSVGRGGRNRPEDVRTIQSALNGVCPADGGPILKLDVDGIVGPITIAAIEKYQNRQLGWSDGRVDPDGPTIHALNGQSGGQAAPAKAGPKAAPPKATAQQNAQFVERIGSLLPRARHWISMAQLNIDMASDYLRRAPAGRNDPFPSLHDIGRGQLALFDKYFHTQKEPTTTKLAQLQRAKRLYDSMTTVITHSLLQAPMFGWGVGYFQPDPADGTIAALDYVAYTFYGGWQARRPDGKPRLSGDDNYKGAKNLREDTIFFPVGQLLTKTDNFMLETIIHELAHFVGPGVRSPDRIGDHTYDTKANFLTVNNWTALHTAECYGYFAAESALRNAITIPIH
ncbi:peptidoglycan-binding domain-containing protein [Methylosinus sp. PW1]|uniref:peptidoglycan-binding domain-containing protein n=1 Tax=Methylosinus sp. PW1 TaxID=107636 RepID=UPI00056AFCC3|nr:peptidoglycan-binding domain-containing protein [Methylosinus sp. PW1]